MPDLTQLGAYFLPLKKSSATISPDRYGLIPAPKLTLVGVSIKKKGGTRFFGKNTPEYPLLKSPVAFGAF